MSIDTELEVERAVATWLIAGLGHGAHSRRRLDGTLTVVKVEAAPSGGVGFATVGFYREVFKAATDVRFELVAASRGIDLTLYLHEAVTILRRAGEAPREGRWIANLAARAGMSELARRYPHAVFLPPNYWDELDVLELDGFSLYPVFVLPINQAEADHLYRVGTKAFLDLVAESEIDGFDLDRQSML